MVYTIALLTCSLGFSNLYGMAIEAYKTAAEQKVTLAAIAAQKGCGVPRVSRIPFAIKPGVDPCHAVLALLPNGIIFAGGADGSMRLFDGSSLKRIGTQSVQPLEIDSTHYRYEGQCLLNYDRAVFQPLTTPGRKQGQCVPKVLCSLVNGETQLEESDEMSVEESRRQYFANNFLAAYFYTGSSWVNRYNYRRTEILINGLNDDAEVFMQKTRSRFWGNRTVYYSQMHRVGVICGQEQPIVYFCHEKEGKFVFSTGVHHHPVVTVALSHNGFTAASGDDNGIIAVWDLTHKEGPRCITKFRMDYPVVGLALNKEGNVLVARDIRDQLSLWRLDEIAKASL